MTRREKDNPTDLEEIPTWAAKNLGGLAASVVVIGLVGLAFCAFSRRPA